MHSPVRPAIGILAAIFAALALLVALLLGLGHPEAEGQSTPTLAVDADPAGNLATSVGQIDDCVVLSLGETADIDVVLLGGDGLLGFEFQFEYDPSIVEILDSDLKLFLASAPGSRVIDVSEPLPDPDHLHLFGAADIGRDSLDSGSGVLARITLTVKGPGVSPLSIPKTDVNEDGKFDLGPRLIGPDGSFLGDQDGDEFFDGPKLEAWVAVDTPCPLPTTSPLSGSTPEGGSGPTSVELVLLPPVPFSISDSVPSDQESSRSPEDDGSVDSPGPSDEDDPDNASAGGDAGSGNGASTSGEGNGTSGDSDSDSGSSSVAGTSSSSPSGWGLPIWLVVIFASVMLVSGGFIIVRSLLGRS